MESSQERNTGISSLYYDIDSRPFFWTFRLFAAMRNFFVKFNYLPLTYYLVLMPLCLPSCVEEPERSLTLLFMMKMVVMMMMMYHVCNSSSRPGHVFPVFCRCDQVGFGWGQAGHTHQLFDYYYYYSLIKAIFAVRCSLQNCFICANDVLEILMISLSYSEPT